MNPTDNGSTLTPDETLRLVAFLAERGHGQAAYDILVAALPAMILAAYGELA